MKLKDWFIQNADIILTDSYRIGYDIVRDNYEPGYNPNGTSSSMPLCTEGDLFRNGDGSVWNTTWATNLCIIRNSSYEANKLSTMNNNISGDTNYHSGRISTSSGVIPFINVYLGLWDSNKGTGFGSNAYNHTYPYEYFGFISSTDYGDLKFCGNNECGVLPIYYYDYYGEFIANQFYPFGMICFAKIDYYTRRNSSNNSDPLYTHYRLLYVPYSPSIGGQHNIVIDEIQYNTLYMVTYNYDSIYKANFKLKVLCVYDIFDPSKIYYPIGYPYSGSYFGGQLFFATGSSTSTANGKYAEFRSSLFNIGIQQNEYESDIYRGYFIRIAYDDSLTPTGIIM